MAKLAYLLAMTCLICITITLSLPGCLCVRSSPKDNGAVVGKTVDSSMDEVSESNSDSTGVSVNEVDQFSSATEEEDLEVQHTYESETLHPCYATLAKAQLEGRTEADSGDGDIPLIEVDCRRMLDDYSSRSPKANTNPKCANTKRC